MRTITHPNRFKQGVRVIGLTRRVKDGNVSPKNDMWTITHSTEEFDKILTNLLNCAQYSEEMFGENWRVYSTVDERCLLKARHKFDHLKLNADYANDFSFYQRLDSTWLSAVHSPSSRKSSLFLFDCDTDIDYENVLAVGHELGIESSFYVYKTKNGWHVISPPFNYRAYPALESQSPTNASMLWGWGEAK